MQEGIGAKLPVHAVVFASVQLFPAIQFLLHVADTYRDALRAIHIYCTSDQRRSSEPAQRLLEAARDWCLLRDLRPDFDIAEGEMWPPSVRRGLVDWFDSDPQALWLVNVTGGTKPMSAAAIEVTHSSNLPRRRVIYQEINGQWFELAPDADGLLDATQLEPVKDPAVPLGDALDRLLPLDDLVALQFSAQHRVTTEQIRALAIEEATRHAIHHRWNWGAALAEAGYLDTVVAGGVPFEMYVGAGLQQSGLRVSHSLKVHDALVPTQVVREIDLVAGHRGRLIFIDVKLGNVREEAKGTQLADIAELAHSLGGRGALAIAVRPSWQDSPYTRRLAEALQVKVATQADSANLFSRLLEWIDPRLRPTPAVERAQAMLREHQAKGKPVLGEGKLGGYEIRESGVLDLTASMHSVMALRQRGWAVARLPDGGFLLGLSRAQIRPSGAKLPNPVYAALRDGLGECTSHLTVKGEALAMPRIQFKLKPKVSEGHLMKRIESVLLPFIDSSPNGTGRFE